MNCPHLVGKPKLIFIQSCRGEKTSPQVLLYGKHSTFEFLRIATADSPAPETESLIAVPEFTDMMIFKSTIPGKVSYRSTIQGSWFIQTLCKVYAEHAHNKHVDELNTKTSIELSENCHEGCRQVPEHTKRLFKKNLYLHPGLNID